LGAPRLGEPQLVGLVLAASLVLGIAALGLYLSLATGGREGLAGVYRALEDPPSGVRVEYYNASLDGLLHEEIVYSVSQSRLHRYHMLYRAWEAPLTDGMNDHPHIQALSVSCPPGFAPYIVDHGGSVNTTAPEWARKKLVGILREHRAADEAGCYYPGGAIPPGEYRVAYTFRLYPPARCGGGGCVVSLLLAAGGRHLRYESVRVEIRGASEALLDPLATSLYQEAGGGGSVIIKGGPLHSGEPLRVFLRFPEGGTPGSWWRVGPRLPGGSRTTPAGMCGCAMRP
jgi:hypothetical protein